MRTRVCLISTEIFAWGKHGGFGRATRLIGSELAKRGLEVFAVVPRRPGQRTVENLDGITVLGFPPLRPWRMVQLFREVDADVYHSCEVSLGTALAQKAMPRRRHMITFRDPRDLKDWALELARPSLNRAQVLGNYLFESSPLLRAAVRRADALYTIAHWLVPKVQRMYRPGIQPQFLPTPVAIPEEGAKADRPTVCYLARLDRRKRPELFFDLARRFPDVRFVALGKSRDPGYEQRLRQAYGGLPNVELLGLVDQFSSGLHGRRLAESWVMVNTATREAMPNAFLEAAAHGCAILSAVDPDGFASRFGYRAARDDFAAALLGCWRASGGGSAASSRAGTSAKCSLPIGRWTSTSRPIARCWPIAGRRCRGSLPTPRAGALKERAAERATRNSRTFDRPSDAPARTRCRRS